MKVSSEGRVVAGQKEKPEGFFPRALEIMPASLDFARDGLSNAPKASDLLSHTSVSSSARRAGTQPMHAWELCGHRAQAGEKEKPEGFLPRALEIMPAATYSPTQFPMQYHRR